MAQLKCTECGQIFDGNLNECPNCGCPSNECIPSDDSVDEINGGSNSKESKLKTYHNNGNSHDDSANKPLCNGVKCVAAVLFTGFLCLRV